MIYSTIITLLFLGALFMYLWTLAGHGKLRAVLRTALRAADAYKPGGRDHVRIPYNQLAELLDWRSEAKNYPMRTDSFTGKAVADWYRRD